MIGALWTGITGLQSHQKALDSESNNISNVNTVGFKSSRVSFADQMYQDKIGKGSKILDAEKLFTQGNLKLTGVAYDMAISGEGFFQVQNTKVSPSEVFYTRAGNFRMGLDGKLTDAAGNSVLGYAMSTVPETINAATTGSTDTTLSFVDTTGYSDTTTKFSDNTHTKLGDSKVIKFSEGIESRVLKMSDYSTSAESKGSQDIAIGGNSGHSVITPATLISNIETAITEYRSALSAYQNDPTGDSTDPVRQVEEIVPGYVAGTDEVFTFTIEGNTVEITVADGEAALSYEKADGSTATVPADGTTVDSADDVREMLAYKINTDSTLKKYIVATDDGTNLDVRTKFVDGEFSLNYTGNSAQNPVGAGSDTTARVEGAGLKAMEAARKDLMTYIKMAGANALELTLSTDLSGRPSDEVQLRLDYGNITDSPFGDFTVDSDGVITILQGGAYFAVGQVALVKFNNNRGLEPVGDNMYRANEAITGIPYYKPYNNSIGKVEGSTLELSNSDLSESLVNLMVYQRAFEANAKTITTSDTLLQTLINLKR
jgi:flagellar hook protein FlgE